jgi:hypothetical protein
MKRLVLVALLALTPACVASTPEPPARGEAPPAPLPELRSAAPAPGMIWVPGAWHHDGVQYVWIPGRWESPPPRPTST